MEVLAAHTSRIIGLGGLLLYAVAPIAFCAFASGQQDKEQPGFSEYDIKAAYLINFAKYVEWPKGTFPDPDATFKVGILGDNPFGDTLSALAREQDINGRRLEIIHSDDAGELTNCQIVFLTGKTPTIPREELDTLGEHAILTVGEQKDFATNGGMINFVIIETKKVRFEINLKSARQAELKVSPRLLKLAIRVLD